MDITTVLGFFFQIREQIRTNEALRTALSTVWTAFTQAYAAFDEAYAQQRKWAQSEELEDLDKQRDKALSAFLQAIKTMMASPNAEKAQRAKYPSDNTAYTIKNASIIEATVDGKPYFRITLKEKVTSTMHCDLYFYNNNKTYEVKMWR